MQNRKLTIIIFAVIITGMTAPTAGQIVYGQPTAGDLRVMYTHWSDESDSVTYDVDQFAIPLVGFIPLQENLELHFYAASASTTLDAGGTDYDIAGFTDMRLQVNHSLVEDQVLVSLGVNLPTGKKTLSVSEERPVMEILTQNYLSFPIRRFGEGFGANVLVGLAAASGNARYGGTVSYQFNGPYEAYEGRGDYSPGNMLMASASADTRADAWTLGADVSFTTYAADKVEDRKVFDQSDQFDIHAGVRYDDETYAFHSDIRYLIRGRNTRYDVNEAVFDQLKFYGNEFYLSARFAYSPNKLWFFAPLADLRLIAGDEYGFGPSNTVGVGLEAGRTITEGLTFGAGFKYFMGSADDGNIDLSGYQATAGLLAAF